MKPPLNQPLEPPAADPSVCVYSGTVADPGFRRSTFLFTMGTPSNRNHWTEYGRAASVSNSEVTDRPRRSVLSLSLQYTNGCMKNSALAAAILLALTGAPAFSQSLPSTLPSRNREYYAGVPAQPQGHSWLFHIAGKYYRAKITHDEVRLGPDWKPSMPLPLSFSKAEQLARAELNKLVADSASWEVTDLQLKRIPDEDQPIWTTPSLAGTGLEFERGLNGDQAKWFYLIGMEPTEGSSRQKHDSFFAVMNLTGVVGKIEEVTAAN